jgi:hypothetical protein
MQGVTVSQEATDYVRSKKMQRPNIVVYRDASGIILGYTTKRLRFVPKVRLMDKEPDELFVVAGSSAGIPVWVERGLLPGLAGSSITITLRKGITKSLALQLDTPTQT